MGEETQSVVEKLSEIKPLPLDLSAVTREVLEEDRFQRRQEAAKKVRHVIQGISVCNHRIQEAKSNIQKAEAAIERGLNKIKQIESGNTSILDAIKLDQPAEKALGLKGDGKEEIETEEISNS